ncbi:MAG: hypothetical protein FJ090_16345 [Deltaproteobacteria bacterium]|nr:hypothetical protein [Deltaproteobacteria bacterium]
MPPRVAEPRGGRSVRDLPADPEPTPAFLARPILPEGSDPPAAAARPIASPIASPVPPPRTVASPEDPPAKVPRNWSMEPIPRGPQVEQERPSAPGGDRGEESDFDDELEAEPGPIDRLLASVKGDPYVMIMSGIGIAFAILLAAYLGLRS